MKTAILSMQRVVNYGSVLQAWSLREMIRDVTGEEAVFLDIEDQPAVESSGSVKTSADYETAAHYSRSLFQRGKRWIIARLSANNKKRIRAFMCQELHLTRENNAGAFDHVVIGSDEVFNHVRGVRLQLHGAVKQAEHVISYAASCGTAKAEDIPEEHLDSVRRAMSKFEAVSVRDAGTEQYVRQLYDGDVLHHLDPVLMGPLHTRKAKRVWLKKYLLVYAYGQRIRTAEEIGAIRRYAKEKGLTIVAMGGSQFWCDLYVPASPMRMLDWFAHADCVVTDTFHGAIFSVINRRRFAVLIRKSNANKLTSLLEDLHLSDQRVSDVNILDSVLDHEPDYNAVDMLLEGERIRARAYLKEHLRHEESAR